MRSPPLSARVGRGQCLAQATGGAGQGLRDLGVYLQAAIDLAETLAGGLAQLLYQLREPAEVGVHTRLHLTQLRVDQLLTPGQRCIRCLGVGAELLAGEHDRLLHRCLHRHVALAGRALVGLCHRSRHRLLHHVLGNLQQYWLGSYDGPDAPVGQQPRDGGSCADEENNKEGNQYDFHTHHHDERV